jgi:hypothetical protein
MVDRSALGSRLLASKEEDMLWKWFKDWYGVIIVIVITVLSLPWLIGMAMKYVKWAGLVMGF